MRALHHLKRRFPGERLHGRENPLLERAFDRLAVREPAVVLPDHDRPERFAVRACRKRIEPRPNAPQLIRLVRHPFQLERGYFQRARRTDFSLVRPERVSVAEQVDAARRRPERQTFPRPTEVHPPLPRWGASERPPASAWLDSAGRGGEDASAMTDVSTAGEGEDE